MAENKREADAFEPDPNAWMLTFSDLVMLLLTFFVLLLTMSSMDTKKLKKLFTHFTGATGVLELTEAGDVEAFSRFVERYRSTDSVVVVDNDLIGEMLLPASDAGREIERLIEDIRSLVKIVDDHRGLVVSFQNEILFDSGSADLKPASYPVLERIASAVAASPNDILILGHTDSIPVSSDAFASNWELSVQRGLAVLDYFLKSGGLPADRFFVGGHGAARPMAANDTPARRALNRRVEIIFRHMPT